MLKLGRTCVRKLFVAVLVATAFCGSNSAMAAGKGCVLLPNERDPSEKTLQCGQELTVQPAHGTHYRPLFEKGDPLPSAIRLDSGALLIEFHPAAERPKFQILTPLAIAAVRGTKWAMEVSAARTSTFVIDGAVAVTSVRLNQYVILTSGQGVDISIGDTSLIQKTWGEARIRTLLSRFGE